MSEIPAPLNCPFCLNQSIEAKPGPFTCPNCNTQFEIDDRLECVFGDTHNLRLTAVGTICTSCGLVQAGSREMCLYCGALINAAIQ